MKITTCLLALAAGVLIAGATSPAFAAGKSVAAVTAAVTQDLSAAKKHRRRDRVYREDDEGYEGYEGDYAEPQPYQPYGSYQGSDPTASPRSNLRNQQDLGRCVYDLGYGRYQLCN